MASSIPTSPASAPPAFAIRGLCKSYRGFSLGPLDLELEPGTVLAMIGPNGAGKTTTLRSMMGLTRADAGQVDIFGRRNRPADPAWKLDVGFVSTEQGFRQRWTVARNLQALSGFYPEWSDRRVAGLLERLALQPTTKVRDLSTGDRTKLALVASLGHSPRLLLLDEPTSGLDPVVRAEVLDVLWELLEEGTRSILYSTHILSDISRLADEMVLLRDGRILLRAEKEALLDSWRRLSFRFEGGEIELSEIVGYRRDGTEHQVVTTDAPAVVESLSALGVGEIRQSRMTLEEVVIQLLKSPSPGAGAALRDE